MHHSQARVLLLTLLSSVLLDTVRTAPHTDILSELLRADPTKEEDLTRLLIFKYVSELASARENEVLPKSEEESGPRKEAVRRQLFLSQRERKAGCRNFFWKTFTSC